jgi:hypothetical protein
VLEYTQLPPRFLWSVTQTAAVTNERVAGITPANPIQINPNYTGALFHVRCTNKLNITLGNVIVYGSLHTGGAGAPFFFPAAASANQERLITTGVNLATGEGLLREPMATDSDATITRQALNLVPNALLLEYTTSAPGATPSITFQVWASFIGPMVGGVA